MKIVRNILVLYICISPWSGWGQDWEWVGSFGDAENESLEALVCSADGGYILGGSFEGSLNIGNASLVSQGEEDVYCQIIGMDGSYDTAFSLGGSLEEELADIAVLGDKIHLLGSYSLSATLDSISLETNIGSKGIFIAQYNMNGDVQWAKSIDANILSIAGGMDINASGDIFITGYFYDTLSLGQDSLFANSTEGDLFVIKMNDEGSVLWMTQAGNNGIFRSSDIVLSNDGTIVIGGKFKGEATFGTDQIQTNTADSDVFVAKLDANGQFIWGKKLGGVLEDDFAGIAISNDGNIFVAGYFLGVLSDIGGWSIQTNGINLDGFLVKLDADGNLIFGNRLGGIDDDYVQDIAIKSSQVAITGYFLSETNWGLGNLQSEGSVDGIVGLFDLSGNLDNIFSISGAGLELGDEICYDQNGDIILGGSFSESVLLGNDEFTSNGSFDVFFGKPGVSVSTEDNYLLDEQNIQIFPNPVNDMLFWTGMDGLGLLYNSHGKEVASSKNGRLSVKQLPSGIYFLRLGNIYKKTIIQH